MGHLTDCLTRKINKTMALNCSVSQLLWVIIIYDTTSDQKFPENELYHSVRGRFVGVPENCWGVTWAFTCNEGINSSSISENFLSEWGSSYLRNTVHINGRNCSFCHSTKLKIRNYIKNDHFSSIFYLTKN